MKLDTYRALGRSGLLISPLTLGTMTFGAQRWGAEEAASEEIFNAYVDAGGNSIDTADVYAGGRSEELVGSFIRKRGLRDKVVLATKCGFNTEKGNPHGGGNGRKHVQAALEASLRRLGTDCIDLYWMHVWDTITPVEEVLQTLGDLTRAGKIRYFGFSDLPAWYGARAATLAAAHHGPAPIAMQLEYSLAERNIENEHLPAARECGMGILPWSPLAGGFLAGKYKKEQDAVGGEGRLAGPNPFGDTKFTGRNWAILDELKAVAESLDKPPAQVALAWTLTRPGVTSTIIGASKSGQLRDNIAALDIRLSGGQLERLNSASAPPPIFPYPIFTPAVISTVFGGTSVTGWE